MKCYVISCGVKKEDVENDVLFFSFPKGDKIKKSWIDFTQRKDSFSIQHARICSGHFIPSIDYKCGYEASESRPYFRLLKDDALPRINPERDFELIQLKLEDESKARVKTML